MVLLRLSFREDTLEELGSGRLQRELLENDRQGGIGSGESVLKAELEFLTTWRATDATSTVLAGSGGAGQHRPISGWQSAWKHCFRTLPECTSRDGRFPGTSRRFAAWAV